MSIWTRANNGPVLWDVVKTMKFILEEQKISEV
jgi:hypothetical protein